MKNLATAFAYLFIFMWASAFMHLAITDQNIAGKITYFAISLLHIVAIVYCINRQFFNNKEE